MRLSSKRRMLPRCRLLAFWTGIKVIQISFHSLLCLHSRYELALMAWSHRGPSVEATRSQVEADPVRHPGQINKKPLWYLLTLL